MNREYLFLFGFLSHAIENMQELQVWVSLVRSRSKVKGPEFSEAAFLEIESRLQGFQKTFIKAQQEAEELFLEGED